MLDALLLWGATRNAAAQAESVAHGASQAARQAATGVEDLERQVDRLTLFAMAMAELLAERHGLTEAEILARVQEIDLRDGRRDGRARPTRPPQPCASCDRMLAAYHAQCIYCGAARQRPSAQHHLGR